MTQLSEASLLYFIFLWCFQSNFAGIISNFPTDVTVAEGSKIQIICIVQDLENDEIVSWFKDSVKISEGKNILQQSSRYEIDVDKDNGHYFLIIDPAKRTDKTSKYSCGIYKNGEKITISKDVKITVIEIPNPDCQNRQTKYRSGEMLRLSCESEIGVQKQTLRWITNGTELESLLNKKNNKILLTHQLKLTPEFNGKIYICNLKAAKIERNCTVGPLNVVYKPLIELNGEIMVKQGSVYICSVKANPKVIYYKWIFTPNISESQYQIETGDQTLRLNQLYPSQNGTIMNCQATNDIGSSTMSKILYLPPSNNPDPISSTIDTGQEQNSGKMSSTKILSFVGSCLLLLACIMAVLLCIFVAHSRRYLPGVRVPQPDVYFMPKDSISTMDRTSAQIAGVWKRSIGTQVGLPSDLDRESIYLEIGERKTIM
ncbi:kin of IRRE-like protein 1 [Antedon mediterranea]|uniref:kin of IRRE-like protein 1 n=1 Tax=Antedon mediterranea TaxID=105859 RepID=UPI003AF8ACFF